MLKFALFCLHLFTESFHNCSASFTQIDCRCIIYFVVIYADKGELILYKEECSCGLETAILVVSKI